jgi:CRP/FNR family transcriptional regulator
MSEGRAERAAALTKVPLFSSLTESEMSFLVARAVPRHYRQGELVFAEGDPCEGLYVIESGTVKIFKTSIGGREQVLAVEGPGDSIAELPVFDGGPYPASAAAVTGAGLLFISKKDFQGLCLQHPDVGLRVLKVVSARLRGLVSIIEELSFTTVRHRLLALLVHEAKQKGKRTARGIEFTFATTNQELAFQIGTVRELVSRNLSRLQAASLIKMEGKTVVIPNLAALEEEVTTSE